jgi:hypothetical protein
MIGRLWALVALLFVAGATAAVCDIAPTSDNMTAVYGFTLCCWLGYLAGGASKKRPS